MASSSSKRKRIWVFRASSFDTANRFDDAYYLRMTPIERLEIVQMLREVWKKLGGKGAGRKGLRRSVKIIQQT